MLSKIAQCAPAFGSGCGQSLRCGADMPPEFHFKRKSCALDIRNRVGWEREKTVADGACCESGNRILPVDDADLWPLVGHFRPPFLKSNVLRSSAREREDRVHRSSHLPVECALDRFHTRKLTGEGGIEGKELLTKGSRGNWSLRPRCLGLDATACGREEG